MPNDQRVKTTDAKESDRLDRKFQWANLSKGLAKELARSAGLRVSFAAKDLAVKFGEPPNDALIEALWSTLRDRWLGMRPTSRNPVVTELRKARLGDLSIEVGSKAGQVDYLQSCRVSTRLKVIVLAAFLAEGSQPMMAPSVTVASDPKKSEGPVAPQLTELQSRVAAFFATLTGRAATVDADGDIPFTWGSAHLFLGSVERDVPVPLVRVSGGLVRDVQPTLELLGDLNEVNQSSLFCRFMCIDHTVVVRSHIPAASLSLGELKLFLEEAAGAADRFDTLFAERHGGRMVGTDRGEVVDA